MYVISVKKKKELLKIKWGFAQTSQIATLPARKPQKVQGAHHTVSCRSRLKGTAAHPNQSRRGAPSTKAGQAEVRLQSAVRARWMDIVCGASSADQAHGRRALGEGPCGGGRGVGEPRTRSHYRSKTHLSAAGPPAPVLGDRRHTPRKKLRLYCMPKILHRVLGDRQNTRGLYGRPVPRRDAPPRNNPLPIRSRGAPSEEAAQTTLKENASSAREGRGRGADEGGQG